MFEYCPLCDCILSTWSMVHDITACDEISHAFSHCIWRCTVGLLDRLKFVYKSRLGDFTTRDINVFLGRGGVWQILVPSWWGKSPKPPSKDEKLVLWHAFFLFQMKLCPQNCLIFADMNLRKFLLSHQIAVLFYWTLKLETHMNN